MTENLTTIEGCYYKINLNFTGQEDLADYEIYGAACRLGCSMHHSDFKITEKTDNTCTLIIPPLNAGTHLYQIFIKRQSTNQEFLLLDGRIEVSNRCGDVEHQSINSTAAELDVVFNADEVTVNVTINEGSKGERGERGEKGEQGEKGEPGVTINFDTTPTKDSTNAVTSGGLYDVIFAQNLRLGSTTTVSGNGAVAVGWYAGAKNIGAVALGTFSAASGLSSVAIGHNSQASQGRAVAIGFNTKVKDAGAICLGSFSEASGTSLYTYFYVLSAGSALAATYENGEACLGYVVKDASGNVTACGTRKLSELLTNNTNFAPAALDLDAPAPTPFLPTGITEPIEIKEELTD